MTGAAIWTRGLTQRFGEVTAVNQVDLAVAPGEIYGFLGRNGAGKTTLIRALLGLITPTSGEVTVLGTAVRGGRTPPALWARVGYLVEGPGLYPALTVLEHLQVAARYRSLSPALVDEVIGRLDLGRYSGVRARALSTGNRQRLGLALALMHRPELLILQQPVNALDPAGVVEVRHLLRSLADNGVTVSMSTHVIGEVVELADRSASFAGHLLEELSSERLGDSGRGGFSTFRSPSSPAEALRRCAPGASTHRLTRCRWCAAPDAVQRPDRVATHLVEAGAPPTYLGIEREDLEQHFLRLTDRDRP